jgi:hypothetical protein
VSESQHSKENSFGTGSIAGILSRTSNQDKKRSLQLELNKEKE